MFTARKVGLFIMALSLCVGCGSMIAAGIDDHRVEVKIDRRIVIVPPTKGFGRAMMGMVRHPDGSIYLNTQTQEKLYKSSDNGQTWKPLPVKFDPAVPTGQKLHGLGVSSSGTLYLLHYASASKLFISTSTDGGQKWKTAVVDYTSLALGPDTSKVIPYQDYNSFVELPDGTMMTAIEMYYPETKDYLGSPRRCGFHETVIRSTDGGKTWGDPTSMHQHVAETSLAIDPNDPTHILAVTRMQRMLLPGENRATVVSLTGWPANAVWVYKNGMLLESNDSGNTFHEAAGGLIGAGQCRGTLLWTANDTVVVTHTGGNPPEGPDVRVLARISLDGGDTWVDGSIGGTSQYNQSMTFELVPQPPGHSFVTPTVEISPNHFLTTYAHRDAKYGSKNMMVSGVFWHIEPASGK